MRRPYSYQRSGDESSRWGGRRGTWILFYCHRAAVHLQAIHLWQSNYFGAACSIYPNLHFIPERSLIGCRIFSIRCLQGETSGALKQINGGGGTLNPRGIRGRCWRPEAARCWRRRGAGDGEVHGTYERYRGRRAGDTSASWVRLHQKPQGGPLRSARRKKKASREASVVFYLHEACAWSGHH